MIRSIAWGASLVWRVAKTRWPVSAIVRAIWIDSRSRISPISSTSGSSRSAERRARSNEGLSIPISRWFTAAILWWWTYSIGSSMVSTWTDRVSLIRSMIEASVVDLPEPVGPVTRTRPRGRAASWVTAGGRPSSAKPGIFEGIIRSARVIWPRWTKAFPRSRARSPHEKEKSTSRCSASLAASSSERSEPTSPAMRSPSRIASPSRGRSAPSTRIRAGEPLERRRSVPPRSHSSCSHGSKASRLKLCTGSRPFGVLGAAR